MMAESWSLDKIEDNSCGLFKWRPNWLQKFVSYKYFIAVYLLLGVSQSMIFGYLSVVLSTIEKQFGVKSAEIAWIYSGNEISQIFFVLFLPFIGRTKRRPLWIGLASIISGCGMLLIAMPYFTGRGQDALKRAGKSYIFKYAFVDELLPIIFHISFHKKVFNFIIHFNFSNLSRICW